MTIKAKEQDVSIIAMEVGSRWPLWSDEVRVGVPHLITVVQHGDQPLASLVSRVLRAVTKAKQDGKRVRTLAIACNHRSDRNAIVARAQMARGAIDAMSPQGTILLTADDTVRKEARNVMQLLAESLSNSMPEVGIQVQVSFGAFTSGVFPTSRPVALANDG